MKGLKIVLKTKIILTLILWTISLLLICKDLLSFFGFPVPDPFVFFRLLGAAYTALLVGYILGLRNLQSKSSAHMVISVGIVSNGLAFLILAFFGLKGSWSTWGGCAQVYMWASTIATFGITLGLLRFRHYPDTL